MLEKTLKRLWGRVRYAIWWIARSRASLIGSIIVGFFLVVAAVGPPLFAPHEYGGMNLSFRMLPPFWAEGANLQYFLGTDDLGRDTLSRIIYGARISLIVGVAVVVISAVVGVLLGLIAGYFGGFVDNIIMRLVDIQWSFPNVILALAVMAFLGTTLFNLVLVLVVTSWVSYARVIRQAVLSLREEDFVTAARSLGATNFHIVGRHILPNVMAPILVLATFNLANVILLEAVLSFVGLGIQPPTPSWGSMISLGREYMYTAWWLVTLPGLALMFLVLGVNQLGDGLRDLLDPRLRGII